MRPLARILRCRVTCVARPSLSEALAGIPAAEPVWIDEPFWDFVRPEIARRVTTEGKLVTTRLDTDDAVARGFLGAVQEAARGIEFGALNFLHGAQLHGTRVYRRSDPSNPFISFVEQGSEDSLTVFVDEHHLLDRHGPLTQVRTSPLSLQAIHDDNAANSVSGIRHPRLLGCFATSSSPYPAGDGFEVALDRVRTTLRLAARVATAPHRLRWAWRVLVSRGGSGSPRSPGQGDQRT